MGKKCNSVLCKLLIKIKQFCSMSYRNVPKFSERQAWANSADPDRTAPLGGLSGSTLFAILSASLGYINLRKSHLVQHLG